MLSSKSPSVKVEALFTLGALAVLLALTRQLFVLGRTTFVHDNFLWLYPGFQFFVENLLNGHFPLWNPYPHGGEPFYPLLAQLKLLEPVGFLTVWLGSFFSHDAVLLLNWTRGIEMLVAAGGVYLCLRPVARHLVTRCALVLVLLFSSFLLVNFRQDAFLDHFIWAPYIFILLRRLTVQRDYRWRNWLLCAGLIGLNGQSYFFVGISLFLLFFLVGMLWFGRASLQGVVRAPANRPKALVALLLLAGMSAPNLVLLHEDGRYVHPSRMGRHFAERLGGPLQTNECFEPLSIDSTPSIGMPYEVIYYTGTPASVWDYLQTLSPGSNLSLNVPNDGIYGSPSEAYLYFGLFTWVIAFLGFLCGKDELRKVWMVITVGFGLLNLGPMGVLHRLLFPIFPPLWFLRHTHGFVLFFHLGVLYFFVLGMNHLLALKGRAIFEGERLVWRPGVLLCLVSFAAMTAAIRLPLGTALTVPILGMALTLWMSIRRIGRKTVFVAVLASQILFILIHHPVTIQITSFLICFLVLPGFLFTRILRQKKTATPLMAGLFLGTLFVDLLFDFHAARPLYEYQYSPALIYRADTRTAPLYWPGIRQPVPLYPDTASGRGQGMRSIPNLFRQPFALSSVRLWETKEHGSFRDALLAIRWDSIVLLKNYFTLIHDPAITARAIGETFALGESPFQFKKGIVLAGEGGVNGVLAKPGAFRLLDNNVVMEASEIEREPALAPLVREFAGAFDKGGETLSIERGRYSHDDLELQVKASEPGLLYWSDGFDPNWHAYLNGREIPVHRANVNFKAISLPKGTSQLRFVYRPIAFITSLWLFYGCFFLSLLPSLVPLFGLRLAGRPTRSFRFASGHVV